MPPTWPREHAEDSRTIIRLWTREPGFLRLGLAASPDGPLGSFTLLSPARARAIAADLNAFADEAEPAPVRRA